MLDLLGFRSKSGASYVTVSAEVDGNNGDPRNLVGWPGVDVCVAGAEALGSTGNNVAWISKLAG